jgi:hypothetical protein
MTKLLDKVNKLVALTSSSHEEEARTAAFQACKLIRENSLEVVVGIPSKHESRRRPSPPPPYDPSTHGFQEPNYSRSQVKCDTRILSTKQFKTAIRMANIAKQDGHEGIRFFASQFRLASYGNSVAKCYCRIYHELVGEWTGG